MITALVNIDFYGTEQACWLSRERGAIWAFAGPVVFIIAVRSEPVVRRSSNCIMRLMVQTSHNENTIYRPSLLLWYLLGVRALTNEPVVEPSDTEL